MTGQTEDIRDKLHGTGRQGQDNGDRTAGTDPPEQVGPAGHPGQDSKEKIARI